MDDEQYHAGDDLSERNPALFLESVRLVAQGQRERIVEYDTGGFEIDAVLFQIQPAFALAVLKAHAGTRRISAYCLYVQLSIQRLGLPP